MRYLGGKARIGKWLVEHIAPYASPALKYVEPFLGGANSFQYLAPMFQTRYVGEANASVAAMWEAVRCGWLPPKALTRERYAELKEQTHPSALKGFAGTGCSYRGKWFGGYVPAELWDSYHQRYIRSSVLVAHEQVSKIAPLIQSVKGRVYACDYSEWRITPDCFVYCDPPYATTTGYATEFDHERFWRTARKWRKLGALVIVSEMIAPSDWKILAARERKHMMKIPDSASNDSRIERLYI